MRFPSFLKKYVAPFSKIPREPCDDCGERECPEGDVVCCVGEVCYLTTQEFCERNGGRILPNETDCTENPCEEPGNCCEPGGGCSKKTRLDCVNGGGLFIGEEPCSSCPTEPIVSQLRCVSLEGTGQKFGIAEYDHPDRTGTRFYLGQAVGGALLLKFYSGPGEEDCDIAPSLLLDQCYVSGAKITSIDPFSCDNGEVVQGCQEGTPTSVFSCPVQVTRIIDGRKAAEIETLTPNSLQIEPTGNCEPVEGGGFAKSFASRFNFLIDEDTWVDAIARSAGDICEREDCDRTQLPGACDPCEYKTPLEPEGCQFEGELCTACATSITPSASTFPYRGPGASITGTAVKFFVSIAGNAGGAVDVLIQTTDPSDGNAVVDCEIRTYILPSSGGLESLCVVDELDPPQGLCMSIVSHAARGTGDPMMELPEECPEEP